MLKISTDFNFLGAKAYITVLIRELKNNYVTHILIFKNVSSKEEIFTSNAKNQKWLLF